MAQSSGPGGAWPGTKPERLVGLTRSGRAFQEAWISFYVQWEGNAELLKGHVIVWPTG